MFSPILTDWPIKQKDNHRSSQGTDSWSTPRKLPGSGACFPLSRTDAKASRLNSQSGPAAHGNEINRPWLSFKRPTYKTHETLSHCIISLPLATLTNRLQERQGWVLWRHRWIQRHWVPPPARRNDLEPVKQDIDFHIEGKKATFLSFELWAFGLWRLLAIFGGRQLLKACTVQVGWWLHFAVYMFDRISHFGDCSATSAPPHDRILISLCQAMTKWLCIAHPQPSGTCP